MILLFCNTIELFLKMYKKHIITCFVASLLILFNANADEADVKVQIEEKIKTEFFDKVKELLGVDYDFDGNRAQIATLFNQLSPEEKIQVIEKLKGLAQEAKDPKNVKRQVHVDEVAYINMLGDVQDNGFWSDFFDEYIAILEAENKKNPKPKALVEKETGNFFHGVKSVLDPELRKASNSIIPAKTRQEIENRFNMLDPDTSTEVLEQLNTVRQTVQPSQKNQEPSDLSLVTDELNGVKGGFYSKQDLLNQYQHILKKAEKEHNKNSPSHNTDKEVQDFFDTVKKIFGKNVFSPVASLILKQNSTSIQKLFQVLSHQAQAEVLRKLRLLLKLPSNWEADSGENFSTRMDLVLPELNGKIAKNIFWKKDFLAAYSALLEAVNKKGKKVE